MSRIARLMSTIFSSKIVVFDDFNRSDNNTTMGNAVTGHSWIYYNGVWGISSNLACRISGQQTAAVVDSGLSNCVIKCDVPVVSGVANNTRIAFRAIDKDNMILLLMLNTDSNKWNLFSRISGINTQFASLNKIGSNGDAIKVILNGLNVKIYINDILYYDDTVNLFTDGTKHGIAGTSPYFRARYDNFFVEAL